MRRNMPDNLVFIRHGQSEANVIHNSDENGFGFPELSQDENGNEEEMFTIPDRSWRLTELGVKQAQTMGDWLPLNVGEFDRMITSPFVRTRETAASLNIEKGINGNVWEENRLVRERSWGEIDSMPNEEFYKNYPANVALMNRDPLYWSPPAGESVAGVAENRVHNFLTTLRRESSGKNVLVVTHGEFINASRMVIERWSDEEFVEFKSIPSHKVPNCGTFHYTSVDPETGEKTDMLQWVRRAYPERVDNEWIVKIDEWQHFDRSRFTNKDLSNRALAQRRRLLDNNQ